MLTILDVNNFWSPSGGGVRRYTLEKLKFMADRRDVFYIFAMNSTSEYIEKINDTTLIAHIPSPKVPGNWEYRFTLTKRYIKPLVEKYKPDIIEVGSPYIMPILIRRSIRKLNHRPKVYGFWHADFPITYVNRFFLKFGRIISDFFTNISWAYARSNYRYMSGIMVASRIVGERMIKNGLKNIHLVPLGVDLNIFGPQNKDPELIKKLKAGLPERLTIFFPHRFCGEKGTDTLIKAYPGICKALGHEPSITFAGTGPYLDMVKKAAEKYEHINYIGFINDPVEMAKWHASTELGLALSGWETFGLSIMEALASGQAQIGANAACALEHLTNADCGLVIPPGNVEELTRAIKQIVTENRFDELSKNAVLYASRFGWDECFQKEIDIFTGKSDHLIG